MTPQQRINQLSEMTKELASGEEPELLFLAAAVDVSQPSEDGGYPTHMFLCGSIADAQEMLRSLIFAMMGPTMDWHPVEKLSIGLAATQAVVDAIDEFNLEPKEDDDTDQAESDNAAVSPRDN
jgi:hypothetical protein